MLAALQGTTFDLNESIISTKGSVISFIPFDGSGSLDFINIESSDSNQIIVVGNGISVDKIANMDMLEDGLKSALSDNDLTLIKQAVKIPMKREEDLEITKDIFSNDSEVSDVYDETESSKGAVESSNVLLVNINKNSNNPTAISSTLSILQNGNISESINFIETYTSSDVINSSDYMLILEDVGFDTNGSSTNSTINETVITLADANINNISFLSSNNNHNLEINANIANDAPTSTLEKFDNMSSSVLNILGSVQVLETKAKSLPITELRDIQLNNLNTSSLITNSTFEQENKCMKLSFTSSDIEEVDLGVQATLLNTNSVDGVEGDVIVETNLNEPFTIDLQKSILEENEISTTGADSSISVVGTLTTVTIVLAGDKGTIISSYNSATGEYDYNVNSADNDILSKTTNIEKSIVNATSATTATKKSASFKAVAATEAVATAYVETLQNNNIGTSSVTTQDQTKTTSLASSNASVIPKSSKIASQLSKILSTNDAVASSMSVQEDRIMQINLTSSDIEEVDLGVQATLLNTNSVDGVEGDVIVETNLNEPFTIDLQKSILEENEISTTGADSSISVVGTLTTVTIVLAGDKGTIISSYNSATGEYDYNVNSADNDILSKTTNIENSIVNATSATTATKKSASFKAAAATEAIATAYVETLQNNNIGTSSVTTQDQTKLLAWLLLMLRLFQKVQR